MRLGRTEDCPIQIDYKEIGDSNHVNCTVIVQKMNRWRARLVYNASYNREARKKYIICVCLLIVAQTSIL